jgi:DNA-binding MarR family transcriptional regulator
MVEPASYELITLIKRLAALVHQNIDVLLKPYGLARTQYVALYHLAARPGIKGLELAEIMMLEPATLTGIVDTLQAKGLVERIERSDDKRRKDIMLTKAGRELLMKIPPPGPGVESVLLDSIPEADVEVFKESARKMLQNLENELAKREEQKHAAKTQE